MMIQNMPAKTSLGLLEAEPSPIAQLLPRLAQRDGECKGCGAKTVIFVGKFYCDDCMGRQIDREESWRRNAVLDEQISLKMLRESTIRCTYRTVSSRCQRNAYAAAAKWNRRRNLWICGPGGSGKSVLARCILMSFFDNVRARPKYAIMPNPCDDGWETGKMLLPLTVRYPSVGEISAMKLTDLCRGYEVDLSAWENLSCLLVDDFESATWSDRAASYFRELVGNRMEHSAPTIVVSAFRAHDAMNYVDKQLRHLEIMGSVIRRLDPVEIELEAQMARDYTKDE